jgi:hypothetical protein
MLSDGACGVNVNGVCGFNVSGACGFTASKDDQQPAYTVLRTVFIAVIAPAK